jgi:hypothetical protein
MIPAAAPVIVLAVAIIASRQISPAWFSPGSLLAMAVAAIAVLLPTLGFAFGVGNQMSMLTATWAYRPACLYEAPKQETKLYGSCQITEEWRMVGMPLVDAVPTDFRRHIQYWFTIISSSVAISMAIVYTKSSRRPALLASGVNIYPANDTWSQRPPRLGTSSVFSEPGV